jgi:small-conductance mechanosensitive channel
MTFTWKAVALTLLLAVPGTLQLMALSWTLKAANATAIFSNGLAVALMETAILLMLVNSMLKLSLPGGLAERPVRVGDRITVGDATGTVTRIRIRATTIRDLEQKELLIPNKELITGQLLNWTLTDSRTRIVINVGITYGSDVDRAIEILHELAREDERVLEDPAPGVVFNLFGDNSLNLAFRVFVGTLQDRLPVITDMHRNINRRFNEAGIVIAFPQRDVHFDADRPLRISLEQSPESTSK